MILDIDMKLATEPENVLNRTRKRNEKVVQEKNLVLSKRGRDEGRLSPFSAHDFNQIEEEE